MSLQGVTQQQEQQNYQQTLRFECPISSSRLRLDQPRIPFTDTHSHFHLLAQLQTSSLSLWMTTQVKDMVNLLKHSLFSLCEQETKKSLQDSSTHTHTQSLSVSSLEEKSARVPEPASIFPVLRPEIYFFCLAIQANNNKASDFSGSPLHVSFCV